MANIGKQFTNGQPWTASDEDCSLRWSGGKNGKYFRCGFCGHKFKPGDTVRWQYMNDTGQCGGNIFVCSSCDGSPEELKEKWKDQHVEFEKWRKGRMWYFFRNTLGGAE